MCINDMKPGRQQRFATRLLAIAVLLLVAVSSGYAIEEKPRQSSPLASKHQFGLRLGVWANQGDRPLEFGDFGLQTFSTSINNSSFYIEAYYSRKIMDWLRVELSAGTVNRGTVSVSDSFGEDIGNLLLFPILLQAKIYPLALINLDLQPYLSAGGGLYVGRRSVQFTSNQLTIAGFNQQSETDFNYVVAAGVDWPVASVIALDFNVKYMPITFPNGLVGVTDFGGMTFAVGVKYLYGD